MIMQLIDKVRHPIHIMNGKCRLFVYRGALFGGV